MKWLVSCFEPFDRAASNSSEIVWRGLKELAWGGRVSFAGPLPVSFSRAWPALEREIGSADGILALGQAEGRTKISLECVALNWLDARIADNDGESPRLKPVRPGPDVLWSPIPWADLGENETWVRSYSAGTFVCNHLLYEILHWAKAAGRTGGFVHLPLLGSQRDAQFAGLPRMSDEQAVQGMERILRFLTETGASR